MNLKKAKLVRRLVKLMAFPNKDFVPVIKGKKEMVVGFNSDGTEKKEEFLCITMVYIKDSARAAYKKLKKQYKSREPFPV